MKNLSIAFNAVLLVLVIALFFMYSSLKKSIAPDGQAGNTSAVTKGAKSGLRIAYVNADSITVSYKLMGDIRNAMLQRQNALQGEYETKGRKLQDEYAEYQQKAQAGNISQVDAQKIQQDLQNKKGELDGLQRKQEELMKEAEIKNQQIEVQVQDFIKDYNKKAHYDFILKYNQIGGALLYANDTMDITHYILEGLNKQYADSLQKAKH